MPFNYDKIVNTDLIDFYVGCSESDRLYACKGDIAYFVTSSSRDDGFSHTIIITGVDKNIIRYSCHTTSEIKKS